MRWQAIVQGFRQAVWFGVFQFGVMPPLNAAPIDIEDIPPTLKDWTAWVLYGEESKTCPFIYNSFGDHRCAWPTTLALQLDAEGGAFSQSWQVHSSSWITLPGDSANWPLEVVVDDRPATLIQRNGHPQLQLDPGHHTISGRFAWSRLPESLAIPRDTGLIDLEVSGDVVRAPLVDDNGNLWLRERAMETGPEAAGDQVKLRVFREIIDEIPMRLVTQIELEVSGTQREETLIGALPEQFIPLELESRLPTRLETDGSLRIQVRPGNWTIQLTSRSNAAVDALTLADWPDPWPAEEVWVMEAHNDLRLVEVEGPVSVDPRQTRLPEEWQSLPAWLMSPGREMRFNVIRRGDPEPEPDQLSLHRNLWLDFEGTGYTIQDNISGRMTRGWRLEANPPLQLGRADLDGEPQFITRIPGSERDGVEVRRGQLALTADSRLEEDIADLPAIGWDHDFQWVGATLHLPPGWDLFSSSGIDNVPDTWIKRWTLLDIFLVLIAVLAVRGLWNTKYALLALASLVLIWHEPGAPRYVWLNILAAIALLRVLPQGRFLALVKVYRNLAWLALVVISIPFMVDQVRTGLYPQLDRFGLGFMPGYRGIATDVGMQQFATPPQAPAPMESVMVTERKESGGIEAMDQAGALAEIAVTGSSISQSFNQIDPNANVQTGPGLPDWQWKQIPLSWNGPVQKDQQISLVLLSPAMNLTLNFLRVLLVAALALVTFGFVLGKGGRLQRAAGTLVMALLLPALPYNAPRAAEIPGPELLQELRNRLLAPPECLPECAQSPRLQFDLDDRSLTVRIEIHAAEAIAAPLPARAGLWSPETVVVDGAPAAGLMRGEDGALWVNLSPGAHQIILRGAVPEGASFQLPLPLPPRQIEFTAEGWNVEGIVDRRQVGGQLQFTRIARQTETVEEESELRPRELPPFVQVERTLNLGLDWGVSTRVVRQSNSGAAVVIEVPLISGESVTTDGVKVEDGKVLVNMAAGEVEFEWESSLEKTDAIALAAPDTTEWTETWRADVSPIWHVETSGLAVVHHQDPGGHWLPEWRPWPGETAQLAVTRPEGVPGRTLTIDQTNLRVTPGSRATDASLDLTLRSSQGGQHTLTLPAGVELQSVIINGEIQPVRQEEGKVTLPLSPGTQSVNLTFRSAAGITSLFRTPEIVLGAPGVNTRLNITLGQDRWPLVLGGPLLGPAVLFWGVLLVVILIAIGLGRVKITPLTTWTWILLGIGLTQTTIGEAVIIVGWLFALGGRARIKPDVDRRWFNFAQILLGLLTLIALSTLFGAVRHGLLGFPEMQITGNGSTAWDLNWYQDRNEASIPQAWVMSVPMWVYRGLMLAWALWLAYALLRWLKWGWGCFSAGGYWRPKPKIETPAAS